MTICAGTLPIRPDLGMSGAKPCRDLSFFLNFAPQQLITVADIDTIRRPQKIALKKKFERDRVQAGTRSGEYWKSLPLRVTKMHEESQPNF